MPMLVLKVFANRIMDANIYGVDEGDDDALNAPATQMKAFFLKKYIQL